MAWHRAGLVELLKSTEADLAHRQRHPTFVQLQVLQRRACLEGFTLQDGLELTQQVQSVLCGGDVLKGLVNEALQTQEHTVAAQAGPQEADWLMR